MSQADATKFIHDLTTDKGLRDEVRKHATPAAVIAAAKQRGYHFAVDELRHAYAAWYKARTGSATPVSAEDLKDLTGASSPGGHHYFDDHSDKYDDYDDTGKPHRVTPPYYD